MSNTGDTGGKKTNQKTQERYEEIVLSHGIYF